jgi:hypothetical protein
VTAAVWTVRRTGCRCGHSWLEHDHYRLGTDCYACPCDKFRKRRWWRR